MHVETTRQAGARASGAAACLIGMVLASACAARAPVGSGAALASMPARPPLAGSAEALEHMRPSLAAARLLVQLAPTAPHQRALADQYLQIGVRDAAYDHYQAALRLAPKDVGALDGLARVWRDWGYLETALPMALRAVYFAPTSPVARNTLGTILLRLGQPAEADRAFTQALALAPGAFWALNNLCYVAIVRGLPAEGVARCERTLRASPGNATVLNNLALAYAASGDLETAAARFSSAAPPSRASYNLGIALMATGHYADAARAFDNASALGPGLTAARARASQSRVLAMHARPKEPRDPSQ